MLRTPATFLGTIVLACCASVACGADFTVATNGQWHTPATWTTATVPTTADNALVGSKATGALATAAVGLDQNTTIGSLYLGRDTGTAGTLDLGSYHLSATNLYFGYTGTGTINRLAGGSFTANTFDIRHGSFAFNVADSVTQAVNMQGASGLTLAGNLTLSDKLNVEDTATLNAAGFNITTTNEILLGWNGTGNPAILNRGALSTTNLYVRNQNFQLTPTDAIKVFNLSAGATTLNTSVAVEVLSLTAGASGVTTETANITRQANVAGGSSLTLGGKLSLSDKLNLQDTGSVLNAAGFDIVATNEFTLGWNGTGNPTLLNRGNLTTTNLDVRNQDFQLRSTDAVTNFTLSNGKTTLGAGVGVRALYIQGGGTATTTQTANVTNILEVASGATANLGAALAVSDKVNIRGAGTVLNAQGNSIAATNQLLIGWDDGAAPTVLNLGSLSSGQLLMSNAMQLTVTSGADTFGSIRLQGNAGLTVAPANGVATGLTITGTAASSLNLSGGAKLHLGYSGTADGWVLRWLNGSAGDHIADLNSLIHAGSIDFTNSVSFSISSPGDGYTYVFVPVPEPATVLGVAALGLGVATAGRRRFRRA